MSAIGVLVVDDDPWTRSALVSALSEGERITVVGEAGDGREAVALARSLRCDVVLMDLQMPGLDGVEATRLLTADDPAAPDRPTRVLVLTGLRDESTLEALRAGASGFLLKRSRADLLPAVERVAAGEGWVDPAVAAEVVGALRENGHRGRRHHRARLSGLTAREREVLVLMTEERTDAEIARDLGLTLPTVRTHATRIRNKTGSRNRSEAVVAAFRGGLVRW